MAGKIPKAHELPRTSGQLGMIGARYLLQVMMILSILLTGQASLAQPPATGTAPNSQTQPTDQLPAPRPVPVSFMPESCDSTEQASQPTPSPEALKTFRRFVDHTIDPQNTLEVILGRSRILVLKESPFRVATAVDEKDAVVAWKIIGTTEIHLIGKRLGSAELNLWFGDPNDPKKQTVLSYFVRVLPDPEVKVRLARFFKDLSDQINRAFPDSVVCLNVVGNDVVVSGQAKDVVEVTHILQIVQSNGPLAERAMNVPLDMSPLPIAPETALPGTGVIPGMTPPAIAQPGITPPGMPQPESGVQTTTVTQAGLTGTTAQTIQQPIGSRAQGRGFNVINLLRVPGEQQVMLKVVVAEVNRSAARSIGVNFSVLNKQGITVFANNTGNIAGQSTGGGASLSGIASAASSAANLTGVLDAGKLILAIDALKAVTKPTFLKNIVSQD